MSFRLIEKIKASKYEVSVVLLMIIICIIIMYRYAVPAPSVPPHLQKYLSVGANKRRTIPPRNLTELIELANRRCEVRNSELLGGAARDTAVLVVLVRRDLARLRLLLLSLARAPPAAALLVFSHSYYDEDIEALVRLVDFCPVLQIYYPHSVQRFPASFPGECGAGAARPRSARAAERKHHWWWTARFVFEMPPRADVHDEMMIFMDEASYVLPDFMHVFRFAKRALSYVPEAEVVSLGRSPAGDLAYDRLLVDSWRPHFAEGVAFNATVWRKIRALGGRFCEYDDTSWSRSLMHVFERFGRGRALAVSGLAPRVLSSAGRRGRPAADEARLFPAAMQAVVLFGRGGALVRENKPPRRGNGGWSDRRDVRLCLAPFDNLSNTLENDL